MPREWPGTTLCIGPGQFRPATHRAMPCLYREKISGFGSSQQPWAIDGGESGSECAYIGCGRRSQGRQRHVEDGLGITPSVPN